MTKTTQRDPNEITMKDDSINEIAMREDSMKSPSLLPCQASTFYGKMKIEYSIEEWIMGIKKYPNCMTI
jgi:hypothetical protein